MTKQITTLQQKNEGGQNPKTKLFEQPIWLLTLEDGEEKVLGKDEAKRLNKIYQKVIRSRMRQIVKFRPDLSTSSNE